ncbi:DUF6801 domain-containing protein [Actinomadura parmotrematis]|uniref:Fibronectin type III domain-containing protein n=1 Tax=Actinomadura parmotrematis TaxID=2864039 RepID=A0ABS7FNZ7_9ACTN|nr:DUF6801 domain-containing protein [Actinomadura parmotrematis]MBW8482118.1 fibronectin type III domain-containing protein [Actinomadura parmotrematis]
MRTKAFLAAAALALPGLAALGGPAAADPVSLTLTYRCQFPLLGAQPVKVTIASDVPAAVDVGAALPPIVVDADAVVGAASVQGLHEVGATTLEGTASAAVTVAAPQGDVKIKAPNAIARTDLPASGDTTVRAHGQTPSIRFTKAGTATIGLGDLVLTLTPRLADGTLTGLDTFESECVQDPGQDATLATVRIGGGTPQHHDYDVKGTAAVKAAGGALPVTGAAAADLDAAGNFTAALTLASAKGTVKLLGFLPVDASVTPVPQGPATGTLKDGTLTGKASVLTRFTAFTLFGLPVGGGDTCQTAAPSDVALSSQGAFDPAAGGRVTGTFELAALTGCGALTGLLGSSVSGPGNTLDVQLTRRADG